MAGMCGCLTLPACTTMSDLLCRRRLLRLLCRSLANEVCTVDEAKAVYPFMGECVINLVFSALAQCLVAKQQPSCFCWCCCWP